MISVSDLRSAFSGKRVLVTGHTGFKGSWLCAILHQIGADVFGFSIAAPDDPRHAYYALGIEATLKNSKTALGDVRSIDRLREEMTNARPDFLFHLAAQPIVSTSYRDPYATFCTNTIGVLNVLELLRVDNFPTTSVIITSDKCYKNKERTLPYSEMDEMGGDDPYSASKGAAELIFHSYETSYPNLGMQHGLSTVRAGNVFGGGDWSMNRLIPDCARDLFSREEVEIRMPEAVRPWTFVVDILFGYLLLAANLRATPQAFRGSWNFASGETKTVADVVGIFISQLNFGRVVVNTNSSFGKEAGLLLIDPGKAERQLGWRCKFPVEVALRHTAEWYRLQREGNDMRAHSDQFLSSHYLHS
ncbi:CDP-glucose 4,6-dehydratase [bacterium YEK0313]|nr:CDP-glucose 4,6-dehydratase [bacterium YEK0313]